MAETVESFEALINGDLDEVPEQAFLNVSGAEVGVLAKAKQLEGERVTERSEVRPSGGERT